MIVVIFEVWPLQGKVNEYFELANSLRDDLKRIDGFISIERFESVTTPGKFVSLSFWRDEESVRAWRNLEGHRTVQAKGRDGMFTNYRIRVAAVARDYGLSERAEAPMDSRARLG